METYEQKYKEALERARLLKLANPDDVAIQTFVKDSFPELRESEDERIRKAIVRLIEDLLQSDKFFDGISLTDMLAYLEKQKERKPADSVEEEYIENRNDGTYTCATTNDGFDAYMNGFNTGFEEGKITLICALKGWIKEQTKKQ